MLANKHINSKVDNQLGLGRGGRGQAPVLREQFTEICRGQDRVGVGRWGRGPAQDTNPAEKFGISPSPRPAAAALPALTDIS